MGTKADNEVGLGILKSGHTLPPPVQNVLVHLEDKPPVIFKFL